ncbi:hypothetical protein [Sulfurimonas sp.]
MLSAIKTVQKTGKEQFYLNDKKLPLDVLSFWQWSSSELLGNALRGVLAEFIVASAIDILDKPREEWDAYDLKTKNGLKIEIKSSSYLQSWQQNKLSTICFGIQETSDYDYKTKKYDKQKKRQSDIYIFCVLSHKDKNSVDPLNLSQWDFYILETSILNKKVKHQKTITLSSLLQLHPIKIKYDNLKRKIANIESKITNVSTAFT